MGGARALRHDPLSGTDVVIIGAQSAETWDDEHPGNFPLPHWTPAAALPKRVYSSDGQLQEAAPAPAVPSLDLPLPFRCVSLTFRRLFAADARLPAGGGGGGGGGPRAGQASDARWGLAWHGSGTPSCASIPILVRAQGGHQRRPDNPAAAAAAFPCRSLHFAAFHWPLTAFLLPFRRDGVRAGPAEAGWALPFACVFTAFLR